jgi:hypothetical protein
VGIYIFDVYISPRYLRIAVFVLGLVVAGLITRRLLELLRHE